MTCTVAGAGFTTGASRYQYTLRLDQEAIENEYLFDIHEDQEDLAALQELARITPSNDELLALAAESPPPPEWFDQEEERPF